MLNEDNSKILNEESFDSSTIAETENPSSQDSAEENKVQEGGTQSDSAPEKAKLSKSETKNSGTNSEIIFKDNVRIITSKVENGQLKYEVDTKILVNAVVGLFNEFRQCSLKINKNDPILDVLNKIVTYVILADSLEPDASFLEGNYSLSVKQMYLPTDFKGLVHSSYICFDSSLYLIQENHHVPFVTKGSRNDALALVKNLDMPQVKAAFTRLYALLRRADKVNFDSASLKEWMAPVSLSSISEAIFAGAGPKDRLTKSMYPTIDVKINRDNLVETDSINRILLTALRNIVRDIIVK